MDIPEVTVLLFPTYINIGIRDEVDGRSSTITWKMRDITAVYNERTGLSTLKLKNSSEELLVKGKEAAAYVGASQADMDKPWYRKEGTKIWGRNLSILSGIATALLILYFLLVPWLAEKMVGTVSVETEQRFGNAMYDALNLSASEDTAAGAAITDFFKEMNVSSAYPVKIAVVNSEVLNAFALPGGRIVVYSGLLKKMDSYPELAALLSYEFTHVNNKHVTKSVFRRLGSKIFLRLLMGSVGSATDVIANQADDLRSLNYSRSLEREADKEGLQLLVERRIDPRGFTDLFKHLAENSTRYKVPVFLESHPAIDERIDYIEQLAKGASVAENSRLKAIFEKLK
jgi:Zn-dependent protease with chaperone function